MGSRNECQAGRELSLVIFRDLVDREWVFPADPQGAKYRGVHRCIWLKVEVITRERSSSPSPSPSFSFFFLVAPRIRLSIRGRLTAKDVRREKIDETPEDLTFFFVIRYYWKSHRHGRFILRRSRALNVQISTKKKEPSLAVTPFPSRVFLMNLAISQSERANGTVESYPTESSSRRVSVSVCDASHHTRAFWFHVTEH